MIEAHPHLHPLGTMIGGTVEVTVTAVDGLTNMMTATLSMMTGEGEGMMTAGDGRMTARDGTRTDTETAVIIGIPETLDPIGDIDPWCILFSTYRLWRRKKLMGKLLDLDP